jgi:hypothetical protein
MKSQRKQTSLDFRDTRNYVEPLAREHGMNFGVSTQITVPIKLSVTEMEILALTGENTFI